MSDIKEEAHELQLTTPLQKLQHRIDLDLMKTRLTEYFLANNVYSFNLVEAPSNYYELTLDQRKEILKCHTKDIICKSIILENTAYDNTIQHELYQRYYLTIVQYVNEFNAEKIAKNLKTYLNTKYNLKLANKHFHFRLAKNEVAFEMTGFTFNAIGPFLMKCSDLKILFPMNLYNIYPQYFYVGGGEYELKVGITVDDFMKLLGKNTIVLDSATHYQ
jgi:hypothetical protein